MLWFFEVYIYENMKTMCPFRVSPQWLCGNSCTWAHDVWLMNRTSCAQVHELPQNHCGDNREGTLFLWLHMHIYYAHLASVKFEHSVCHGPIMTSYIYVYIYTANVAKSSHQDRGLGYLHLFLCYTYTLLLCWKIKKLLRSLFSLTN